MMQQHKRLQTGKLDMIGADDLRELLKVSAQLNSTLDLDELLNLIMHVATRLTNSQAASILLVDQKTKELHFVASTGGNLPSDDVTVPLDGSIAGWVVQHNETIIIDDVHQDNRWFSNLDQNTTFLTNSILAAPLTTNDKTIGALEVINKKEGNRFSEKDIAILETLAAQSAIAITKARLFAQSDLLAEIMHELKTPLMSLTTASELLGRGILPEEKQADMVGIIQRESKRLATMTKDFVDFARMESGRMRFVKRPLSLRRIIREVVELTQPQAAQRNINIITDIPKDLPKTASPKFVMGDPDRIKQVFLNLISNGIKYNKDDGRIAITAHRAEERVTFYISDNGIGISEKDAANLFERFYRIPGRSNKAEGSGLGLAIAKKIIDEHGGKIEVKSKVGHGTTFSITLPLQSKTKPVQAS